MNEKRLESFSFGLFVLFAGITSLLVNLDILQWGIILDFVVAYWPLFIIVAGLRMIGVSQLQSGYFGIILDLVFYSVILLSLVYAKDRLFPTIVQQTAEQVTQSVNRSEFPLATKKEYVLNFGAADVMIQDQNSNRYLFARGPEGLTVTTDGNKSGPLATMTLKNEPTNRVLRFANFRDPEKIDVELGVTDVQALLNINLGASKGTLVLDETIVNELHSNVGAGDLDIQLSGVAIAPVIDIRVGAGKTVLRISGEESVKLDYSVGAGSLTLKSTRRSLDKEFGGVGTKGVFEVVPNPRVTIKIAVGAGAVEVILD